jgi:hypothetical protein
MEHHFYRFDPLTRLSGWAAFGPISSGLSLNFHFDRDGRKRLDSAVLTADRIDQAAWSEGVAASAATFQGSSSSMRLIG